MYTVGVIGLGNIAAMYGKPGERTPYCHVGGIRQSGKVRLTAVADRLELAREVFRERWGEAFPEAAYYDGSTSLLAAGVPDIVAVCVRGPQHFETMLEVIAAGPKAIFLEKPPSCSLAEMDRMVAAAKAKGIPITVSYSRHWAPHILRLQGLVREGLIGEVRTVIGYTGYAFLSFASHVTDLICQFAGYCPASVFARGRVPEQEAPAGYEPEPHLDNMLIEFANGVHGTQVGNDGEHGGFYCDVLGTKGMVRAGMYLPPQAIDKDRNPIPLEMPPAASVFTVAYDQIADHQDGGPLPHCTNDEFVVVNEIGFAGIESVLTGKPVRVPVANRERMIYANG
ncbi:MAG: Gfo/Idh/MocA family protein [Armatimonadota bacterium]